MAAVLPLALLALLVVVTELTAASRCPHHCTCLAADVINCTLHGGTWAPVISALPPFVNKLVVWDARLIADNITVVARSRLESVSLSGVVADGRALFTVVTAFYPGLSSLRMQHSDLRELLPADFPAQDRLVHLDLSHNELRSMSSEAFGDLLPALLSLDLSFNRLEYLNVTLLHGLTSLHTLNLQHNHLKMISPGTFRGVNRLTDVNLASNLLDSLREEVFDSLDALHKLGLDGNPWACHCGVLWLLTGTINTSGVVCASPSEMSGVPLASVDKASLTCGPVDVELDTNGTVIFQMHSTVIDCVVSGYPRPSIVWLTPRGPLLHGHNQRWLPADIIRDPPPASRSFVGIPTYYESQIQLLMNGSLILSQFRNYFHGHYTCVAYGADGTANATLFIGVASAVTYYLTVAWMVGAMSAAGILVFAVFVCLLHNCVQRVCAEPRSHVKVLNVLIEPRNDMTITITCPPGYDDAPAAGVHPGPAPWRGLETVDEDSVDDPDSSSSPRPLAPTNSEAEVDSVENSPALSTSSDSAACREAARTLEGVRTRLRYGVESGVGRIRTSAQYMRSTSSRKIQTMRDSTSHYAQSVRDSSSYYAHAVRESSSRYIRNVRDSSTGYVRRVYSGVAGGVEQMKSHMQSMRELCGTGEMIQTVSMVSVSTDVDSHDRIQVVKNVSFV